MNIEYIGEHILPGIIGKLSLYVAFGASIIAFILYFLNTKHATNSRPVKYKNLARTFFVAHVVGVLVAGGTLFFMIAKHYFEYQYVWQYTSKDLPIQYMISAFWAGQEGSFLIWTIWQALLGLLLMLKAREWEWSTMTIYSLAQVFTVATLLGLDFGFTTIGRSPFMLAREMVGDITGSIFTDPNYLKMLTDGNGLNPLLENIWMTTHPPILFLGYASVVIPFCFVVAGLWQKKYTEWIKPALPYLVFAVLILGIGIILGGMWAYVSLTFGGFWAWDPVENASLVPWLVMVAALHFAIVAKKQANALLFASVFTPMGFFMVLYASFLTRSGILGETSVHAFGENGMLTQLVVTMLVFLAIPLYFIIRNLKNLKIKSEENTWSREFWMFAGALVLLLSAFQITFVTSVPVWNKLFGFNFAPPVDTVHYFNRWQMPFAILITLFIGAASYLWYNTTDMKVFARKAGLSAGIALALTILIELTFVPLNLLYFLYLFASLFTIIASIDIMLKLFKKSVNAGGMITHLGFGIFLAGVLITFSNSTTISHNTSGFHLGDEKTNAENQVMIKGDTVPMGNYLAIYNNRETKGRETFYTIDFYRSSGGNQLEKAFTVKPSVNRNERMGNVYNPSTENFWNRDIYTYISFAEDNPGSFPIIDQTEAQVGDTLRMTMSLLVLDSVTVFPKADKKHPESIDPSNITLTAHLRLLDMRLGKIVKTQAYYIIQNSEVTRRGGLIPEAGYRIVFEGVSENPGKITLSVFEDKMDYIVVKAVINPYINLVWVGAFITFLGLLFTLRKRIVLAR